jgi:hypothetical protein
MSTLSVVLLQLCMGQEAPMHSSESKRCILAEQHAVMPHMFHYTVRADSFVRCEIVRRVRVQLALQLTAPVVPQHHSGSAQRTSSRKQPVCAVGTLPASCSSDEVKRELA